MVHFAASIPFVGLSDREDGTWDEMFTGDEAVLLALIATMDVEGASDEAEALIRRIWAEPDPGCQEPLLRELAHLILRLAARMDRWLGSAEGHASDGASRHLFERLVGETFGPRLRRLLGLLRHVERAGFFEEEVLVVVEGCRSSWFFELDIEIDPWEEERWLERLVQEVLDAATAFVSAVRELVDSAGPALERSLEQPTHAPHVALLFAYGETLGHVQEQLNTLPSRVGDYYRRTVLRYAPEPAQPDRVLLALAPIPVHGAAPPRIPQGTEFPAGRSEDGATIAFTSDAPLILTGARLPAIRSWQVERGEDGRVSRVAAESSALPSDGGAAAIFAAGRSLADAAIGLAVASPLLDLPSGVRQVTLRFHKLVCPVPSAQPTDVSHCFAVSASSGTDWTPVPGATAQLGSASDGDTELLVYFTLDEDFPALTGTAPAIRMMLVQEAAVAGDDALAVFQGARFGGVSLEVSVSGVGALSVTTPDGASGAAPRRAPFGTAPIPGAALRIEHPAFLLPLESLTLELDWNGLPTAPDGFAAYYRQYVVGPDRRIVNPYRHPLLTNESFLVDLCAPVGPGGCEAKGAMLFGWDETGTLAPSSAFIVTRDGASDGKCPDRALTMTLAAPALGFGDSIYAVNIAHATAVIGHRAERHDWLVPLLIKIITLLLKPLRAAGAALKKGASEVTAFISGVQPPEKMPDAQEPPTGPLSPAASLPNAPWRPTLAGLRVSYTAGAAAPASQESAVPIELFHLAPFGEPARIGVSVATPLFPPTPQSDAFDLRISEWDGEDPLSLLFLLGPTDPAAPPADPVTWTYRTDDGWAPLPPEPQPTDGTRGLTTTGILTLPPLRTGGADIWLRASLGNGRPPVARILADAVGATRVIGANQRSVVSVPADTVRSPAGLAGIARVAQPLASFGGRAADDDEGEMEHVAERVSTRARGILPNDIERLLLERFPDVARVRLFPSVRGMPGGVRIVVVPVQGGPTPPDPVRPHAPAELRGAIGTWLASVSSPFSRPDVTDPLYALVDLKVVASFDDPVSDPDRLKGELGALLSPWGEPGLDLDDGAGPRAVEAAVARFVAARPYVLAVTSVSAAAAGTADGALAVPVPGTLDVLAVASPGSGC
jgi:hypothetical protein